MFYIPSSWQLVHVNNFSDKTFEFKNYVLPNNNLSHVSSYKKRHKLDEAHNIEIIDNKTLVDPIIKVIGEILCPYTCKFVLDNGISLDPNLLYETVLSNGFTIIDKSKECLYLSKFLRWMNCPYTFKVHGEFKLAWNSGGIELVNKDECNDNFLDKKLYKKDLKAGHVYGTTCGSLYCYLGEFNYLSPINPYTNRKIFEVKMKKSKPLYLNVNSIYMDNNEMTPRKVFKRFNDSLLSVSERKPYEDTCYHYGPLKSSLELFFKRIMYPNLTQPTSMTIFPNDGIVRALTASKTDLNIPSDRLRIIGKGSKLSTLLIELI